MKSRHTIFAVGAALLVALAFTLTVRAQPEAVGKTWTVDNVHSSVVFKINHMGVAPFYGTFNQIEGAITTGDSPSFQFTIPIDSIDTRNEMRDAHVKNPDFFDAEQYPTMSFESTAVETDGDDHHVTGELTMHGVTKSIEVVITKTGEVTHERMGHVIGFETTFTVKRSDFGMDQMIGPLGDEVTLMLGFEAKAD